MKENKLENLVWIIFTFIGALFIIISLFVFGNVFNYENKVATEGTITRIYDNDGDSSLSVAYVVDGKKYETRLSFYSSNFYEGKKINIYYDKDNPNEIGIKSLDLLFLIIPGIGLIFLIIGGAAILIKNNKKKFEQKLKTHGQLIYADYVETTLNTSYHVNGKNPYNVICEWHNTTDGKKYLFKSKNLWLNPEDIIKGKNIKQFPVYIDNNDITKYVVDIDALTEDIVDLT